MKPKPSAIPPPKNWSKHVTFALVCASALGRAVVTQVRGWAIDSPLERIRLRADCERLRALVAQQQEELGLLRMRFERVPSKSRPHFTPPERLRVLQLKAASGWSAAETARRLLLAPSTITSWLRRLDEEGEGALVKVPVPVNRFPDLVACVVRQLKSAFPSLGKVKLAEFLARGGLHLSASTVQRMVRERPPHGKPAGSPAGSASNDVPAPSGELEAAQKHTVSAR